MKPYSIDLRQKVVETYLAGGISQRKVAERFRVAPSFVGKLLKQYRETGSVEPKVRTEQTPLKLNPEQLATLEQLVHDHNDATLAELRE
ncbi:MAG: helix-turn-helix domain-containing protein, partial [Cyanobacteria bacterium P01_D01_bin.56]